ncbi:hypothetical protein [Phyllobacterium myrsinacearum]|uniref:Uncharacterized protein n=1 Tax=Phyllobacterium myrsinacearum TaxID=28101 RepID=A0A839ES00_9HYPH|nr:hypothetical protein [Phyllobacterium myrsinacearum]MBA8881709.1 hypothetical protein [Phyllobacterium myrsinacearum]
MFNDNVISLGSRKPLSQVIEEQKAEEKEIEKLTKDCLLEMLGKLTKLVETGRLESLIIAGRDPESGLFLSDMVFPGETKFNAHAFAYVGLLESLKLEMADCASMSPVIGLDGKEINPHIEYVEGEEGEEGEN